MKASKHVCFQSPSARPGDCEAGTRIAGISAVSTYWKTRVSDCPRRTRALIPRETLRPCRSPNPRRMSRPADRATASGEVNQGHPLCFCKSHRLSGTLRQARGDGIRSRRLPQ